MRGLRLLLVVGVVLGLASCGGGSNCGEGTHDENGTCVPDEESDADADADSDADADADTDEDGDGVSVEDGDCDDTDPTIYPGASETWGDGIDQDCDGVADVQGASCSADFTVTFPDGTSTTLDGCTNWDFDAAFEYDPDDPPEVIDFTFTLGATTVAEADCRVELVQQGVCGAGYYCQRGGTGLTTMVLMDCSGVGDDYEDTFTAPEGYLRIDRLDAGSTAGFFTDQPLSTTLEGHLHVWTDGGIDLEGNIALTLIQLAGDGEEQTECVVSDGDEDSDGRVAGYFDGDDTSEMACGHTNASPTQPIITIEPSLPATDDDLVCLILTESTDADGDSITYIYEWAVDYQPNGNHTQMVNSSDTTSGEVWTCRVTPSDGIQNGLFGIAGVQIQ